MLYIEFVSLKRRGQDVRVDFSNLHGITSHSLTLSLEASAFTVQPPRHSLYFFFLNKNMAKEMVCRCGRSAIFYRIFEGRHLCKNHFFQSVERKVKRTIAQNNMVEKNDRIAVALSGGKDSSLALYILHKVFGKRPDIKIMAISIDEGIDERETTIKIAKALCKRLGIEHYIYSFKEEFGKGIEEKVKEIRSNGYIEPCTLCGIARRYILNKKSRELGATKLCVGINLDDEIQSILMNYIRGDLYRGARIGPVNNYSVMRGRRLFIPRIKPLREIPEIETELFCRLKGFDLGYKKCPFAGGLRFELKDFLNEMEKRHPGIKYSILHSFDKILPCLRRLREPKLTVCEKCGEPSSKNICRVCELWR